MMLIIYTVDDQAHRMSASNSSRQVSEGRQRYVKKIENNKVQ